jgi:enediyne biosynthesis protein E4
MKLNFLLLTALLWMLSCKQKPKTPALFELKENTGIEFSNDISNTKDFNIFSYRNFYNGGGVGIGDINNDGLADIFFTANMGENKLYLNKGDFKFEDISHKAGLAGKDKWSTGVVMVDINNDGWLDIYVCNAGYQKGIGQEDELYINNHDLSFTESAAKYNLIDNDYTTHAAFFDYDLDGDLDVYMLNNSFIPVNTLNYANKRNLRAKDWPVADFLKGGGDKLLRNDSGKFTDVSEEAGIFGSLIGFGLGVTVGDVNNDHYPDIYISNDFFERDYLYLNQKDGTFKEDLENCMPHISFSSMGADMGDINNDGYQDIFVTDMLPDDDYRLKTTASFEDIDVFRLKQKQGFHNQFMQNTLQLNNGNGMFTEIGHYSGVSASDWSWGGLMFDADNDGLSDIFVCNGIYNDVTDQDFIDFFANDVVQKMVFTGEKEQVDDIISKMPSVPIANKAFKNLGNLQFDDAGNEWGLTQTSFSNGAAYGDLDNDGDLDLVVNNVNQDAFVYKNNSRERLKNNYIAIQLKGNKQNSFAIGSSIKLYAGNEIISRQVVPSRGFQSSVDYKTVIGLGQKTTIDSLIIIWPDATYSRHDRPELNKLHLIEQPVTSDRYIDKAANVSTLLQPVNIQLDKHREDEFIDFYYERNIPMLLSREGPKAATGDVNGDGLDDVFICGGAGQAGQLFLQTPNGFEKKEIPVFMEDAAFEDVSALFFDKDNDGDLDLFVGSGGNNHPPRNRLMRNRLYVNDSKGNFLADSLAMPAAGMNNAVAVAEDVDNDGDLDLFVGSRSIPYNYGAIPQSYLYINDGKGKFSETNSRNLFQPGLVTDAIWTNVTGNENKELIVVGEWMAPKVYSFGNNQLQELSTNLTGLHGWWKTVTAADLDGDGDQDLILGNVGKNFYLRPAKDEPVKMWINDFDQNGSSEKILTRTVNGKDVPVFLKRELTDQIAALKKQNLRYHSFAKKSIQELFPKDIIDKTEQKLFVYPASCIAWNEGNGKFTVAELPANVQFSSVNAIYCSDINNDGLPDIICAGNQFAFRPQFSRLDASYGNVLLNKGNRQFNLLHSDQSGLLIKGEVKDIVEVKSTAGNYLLFSRNNESPALYRFSNIK